MPRALPPTEENLAEAVRRLKEGGVVAFPTETVYGLGGLTRDVRAIRAIYELKGRPADNPLIAHVLDESMARSLADRFDDRAQRLAAAFWPGPLTLVLPRASDVPVESTSGRPSIAVRSPSHPVARRLLESIGAPISAPSANRSGHISATRAADVAADFAGAGDLLIIDGGDCALGLESTVLDLTGAVPRVLRPGTISAAAVSAVIGPVESSTVHQQSASPGTAPRHYAPQTRARLTSDAELVTALPSGSARAVVLGFARTRVSPPHELIVMPERDHEYAASLYVCLRNADRREANLILIVTPPATSPLWQTIHDRLRRATEVQG